MQSLKISVQASESTIQISYNLLYVELNDAQITIYVAAVTFCSSLI